MGPLTHQWRFEIDIKSFLQAFAVMFVLVLAVSAVVSFLYSLLIHGTGLVDWESSIRFAFIFSIVLPAIQEIDRRKKR
jgi:hypothetical protein